MELNQNLSDKGKEDYALVKLALDGDQRAFAKLMERYRDSLYFMLFKMVNNKSDADDLTIEAFGKAFKFLDQYTPDFAFSTWLFKIASNNCIDFMRKKRNDHVSIDAVVEDQNNDSMLHLTAEGLDPEEDLIMQQKVSLMRIVVKKMKPRYRMLIESRYFKEMSYEEIAVKLDLPIGTVKAQLFRARELLYNILKKSNIRHND